MKNKIDIELKRGLILITFGICLFIMLENISVVITLIKTILSIFAPFLLGLIIAFILNVPMSLIEKRLDKNKKIKIKNANLKRGFSLSLSILMVLLILFFVVALIIPDLGKTVTSFIEQVPTMIMNVEDSLKEISINHPTVKNWLEKIDLNPEMIKMQIESLLKTTGSGILTTSFTFVVSLISGIANFAIALIFAFYVLAEKEKLSSQFRIVLSSFIKGKYVRYFFKITSIANQTFSKFISGQCLEACILGILCFIGMSIFRFPYALSVSVLVAFTALIPVFGAFIAMIIGALLISMTSFSATIWFIIFFLILQQIEGNLIYPKVVGNSVGLPAIWTMMAVTIGGSCFGIFGMLVSVPLSSILYGLLKEYIQKKNVIKIKEISA
ncbi:MAG: AI-2E family transporter [Bacilli bacterium]|nr:AI-2E family transporter [Bacilli bacterium]